MPKSNKGKKIIFRLTDEEDAQLRAESGDINMSAYIRVRVFGRGTRNRDDLRKIAALHVIGRRVQQLAEHPAADAEVIAATLGDVCAAILRLAEEVPEFEDGDASAA